MWYMHQKIVCIDDTVNPRCPKVRLPAKGEVYTIEDFYVDGEGELGLYLVELADFHDQNKRNRVAYRKERFRPLVKTDISELEKLLLTRSLDELVEDTVDA